MLFSGGGAMPDSLYLAFWNLENLFDTETAPRPEKLQKVIGKDLAGWDEDLLALKLAQLAKVICAMNNGAGPDILGVCEVENVNVLHRLCEAIHSAGGRTYKVAHADTGDNRGIDVAFLYDPKVAKTSKKEWFQHWVVKRYATRELFQVNFSVGDKKLVLIGNHWPSRSAGQYESEPFRIIAGETLAYWVERIHEEQGDDVGIVVMGDFNDEPFNRSLNEYALGTSDPAQVLAGKNHYLLNLMWPLCGAGQGSLLYNGRWNMLDQILVSRGIVAGSSGWTVDGGATIEGRPMIEKKKGSGPRRFGMGKGKVDVKGFSDHFPVGVRLVGVR
ncbi:MAG: endonuclease/exonuclease/phosphatase [Deltaproteobacteria bacterium HGW-Deltaproteobacteria-17]|nr:MAG: endonuclease/exonuclease/phosphatase [Deltaproteobacteria bacterium HGW-Deltaproteobacteria-17]